MGIFTTDSGVGQIFAMLLLKNKTKQLSYFVVIAYKSMLEVDTLYFKGCKYYHRNSLMIKIIFS